MATDAERQHAARLLKIHKRNLSRLEEKKALLGGEMDLSVENQIDEERANIAALEPIANPPPQPSPKIQEFVKQTTPGEIDLMMLYLQGTQINSRVTVQEEQTKRIVEEQSRASMWRMQTGEVIETLVAYMHNDKQDADKGRRRNLILQLVNVTLLAIAVGVVVALALQVFGP